jgi:hypothetical protein
MLTVAKPLIGIGVAYDEKYNSGEFPSRVIFEDGNLCHSIRILCPAKYKNHAGTSCIQSQFVDLGSVIS